MRMAELMPLRACGVTAARRAPRSSSCASPRSGSHGGTRQRTPTVVRAQPLFGELLHRTWTPSAVSGERIDDASRGSGGGTGCGVHLEEDEKCQPRLYERPKPSV